MESSKKQPSEAEKEEFKPLMKVDEFFFNEENSKAQEIIDKNQERRRQKRKMKLKSIMEISQSQ